MSDRMPEYMEPNGRLLNQRGEVLNTAAARAADQIARDIYQHACSAGVCKFVIARLIEREIAADLAGADSPEARLARDPEYAVETARPITTGEHHP